MFWKERDTGLVCGTGVEVGREFGRSCVLEEKTDQTSGKRREKTCHLRVGAGDKEQAVSSPWAQIRPPDFPKLAENLTVLTLFYPALADATHSVKE